MEEYPLIHADAGEYIGDFVDRLINLAKTEGTLVGEFNQIHFSVCGTAKARDILAYYGEEADRRH